MNSKGSCGYEEDYYDRAADRGVPWIEYRCARARLVWYHDRDGRYRGDQWRSRVFLEIRTDLDHIWSANQAADKERKRLERTKQELTDLQAKLDHGEWDNGHVNDVIDSLRKSANAIGYRSATGQC